MPSRAYVREPPFNHLDPTSLESTFPQILAHNFHLSLFVGKQENRTRGNMRRSHERAPLPNLPTPAILRPPHLPLIHRQGKRAPRNFISTRAAEVMFPLRFTKCTYLILPLILLQREREGREIRRNGSDDDNDGGGQWG